LATARHVSAGRLPLSTFDETLIDDMSFGTLTRKTLPKQQLRPFVPTKEGNWHLI
jgi:hypothetical protein